MKKRLRMSAFLLLAAMTMVITPVFAKHPSNGRDHPHGKYRHEESRHRSHRHHQKRRHHHKEVVIAGLFFLVMNEIHERNEAREVIKRTTIVLKEAQAVAQQNGSAWGLGKALVHQDYAQTMFDKGKYKTAIYHTLWARAIALHFIDEPIPPENDEDDWRRCDFRSCELVYTELMDMEADYMENAPSPVEMREDVNGIVITDAAALSYEIK
jgi:hypothetical protein